MDISIAATIIAGRLAQQSAPDCKPIQPGTVLFGAYEVVKGPLGGGMGHVYKCRHLRLNEWRAIKEIRPDLNLAELIDLFLQEARTLADIKDDAVVGCYDLLPHEGRLFLVMEFVDGPSLREMLRRSPLSPDEVIRLGRQVGKGLAAVHKLKIIHRDISPDNILIPEGNVDRAKLIDFGVALSAGGGPIGTGDFVGKPAYASPEHFGLNGCAICDRSDIYSLGLVLAEASGAPIQIGGTILEAREHRRKQPQMPANLPARLRKFISPMLHVKPGDRPSAEEIALAEPKEEEGDSLLTALLFGSVLGAGYFLFSTYQG